MLEQLIKEKINYWEIYLREILRLNNKWALRLGTLIIGKITLIRKDLVPDLLYMLLLIMRNKNWEI